MTRRVLIVDDDRSMLDALAASVIEAGHDPITALTWTDALVRFREDKPDLVLLDVMMPTVDGYKLSKMLKAESPSFVPIILLTALEDVDSKRRGMAAGADDFLTKPVGAVELQIRLSSMLRIKELTDQLQEANQKLALLAVTDPLTGLANRRSLYAQLERELQRAQRYTRPLAVLMLDVDHFKKVNDSYGHQVGDKVLRLVGEVMKASVRNSDVAGRFGGEEFMVLAPETTRESALVVAERIRQAVQQRTGTGGLPGVTVSIGAATTEITTIKTSEDLVQLADEALYAAKREGRNRTVLSG